MIDGAVSGENIVETKMLIRPTVWRGIFFIKLVPTQPHFILTDTFLPLENSSTTFTKGQKGNVVH